MTGAEIEALYAQGEVPGNPGFDVLLYSDASGLPGSLIATFGTDLIAPSFGGLVVASATTAPLVSGTQYWLVLEPFDSWSEIRWELGGTSQVPVSFSISSGPWLPPGSAGVQFQIDGVPTTAREPASWTMAGSGLLAIAALSLRRRYSGSAANSRSSQAR